MEITDMFLSSWFFFHRALRLRDWRATAGTCRSLYGTGPLSSGVPDKLLFAPAHRRDENYTAPANEKQAEFFPPRFVRTHWKSGGE